MEEKLYTLRLTREELFTVSFELDRAAEQHDQRATEADELAAQGFGTREPGEYWREQAALCRRVSEKVRAVLDGRPSREV